MRRRESENALVDIPLSEVVLHIFDHKGLVEASSIGNLIKAMQDMGDLVGSLDVGRFIDPDITSLAAQVK